jgi:cellulose synthase (UDP-forming)
MKSKIFSILVMVVSLVFLGGAALFLIQSQGQIVESSQAVAGNQKTISEIASNYIGEMNRDIFKISTSLYLPWYAQAIISFLIILVMMGVTTFMPQARKTVMVITTLVVMRHLIWRGVETLSIEIPPELKSNGDWLILGNTVVGLLIYGAEIVAFFTMILGYFQAWSQTDRPSIPISHIPPERLPAVDIFVCTYNEPISVIYRTLVGCQSIDYPNKKVFLLDDGNRTEMADLTQRLGCHYITRSENIHAKAGNLNNALSQTNADLVLVFDADHVPCTTFLKEVVGFFQDNELAFVQTPQHFFTQDPFQRNLVSGEVTNNEQDLFFHMIQPGNDYWGATFFAGSGAIFRRSALQQIGGFATETITEDVHTGLRLHSKGWKSVYYNRDLSAGLAQDSFSDFIKQRLRWGKGMTQILYYDNPLFIGGLSFPQRICYFAGIWYFFHGLPRFLFLIAPLFFLLLGFRTVNASFLEVMIYYLPSFTCLFLGYTIIARGIRHSFWSEIYETAQCVYLMLTNFQTLLNPGRSKFRVTPKGTMTDKLNFNWYIVLPQIIIAGLIFIGLMMGVVRAMYTPEYWGGILTNIFWSTYNIILLLGAIYVAQERPQLRIAPRVFKRIRCELRLLDGTIAVGYTTNISESGVAIVFDWPIPISGTVALKILDWDINESSVFSVQAVRSNVDANNKFYVGFRVVNRTELQHQKLVRHMFGVADLWAQDYIYTRPSMSFINLILTPFRLASTLERESKRRATRFQTTLTCMVELEGRSVQAYSNEISETGMSIFMKDERAFQKGDTLNLQIQWQDSKMSQLTAQIIRIDGVGGGQVKVGLNFVNLSRDQRLDIINHVYKPWEGLVRVAPTVNKMVRCLIQLENGQQVGGITQEISEMGVVMTPQGGVPIPADAKVLVQLQWEDQSVSTFKGICMDHYQTNAGQSAAMLIYFDHVDIKALDQLSQKIHEPIESKAFQTLQAM